MQQCNFNFNLDCASLWGRRACLGSSSSNTLRRRRSSIRLFLKKQNTENLQQHGSSSCPKMSPHVRRCVHCCNNMLFDTTICVVRRVSSDNNNDKVASFALLSTNAAAAAGEREGGAGGGVAVTELWLLLLLLLCNDPESKSSFFQLQQQLISSPVPPPPTLQPHIVLLPQSIAASCGNVACFVCNIFGLFWVRFGPSVSLVGDVALSDVSFLLAFATPATRIASLHFFFLFFFQPFWLLFLVNSFLLVSAFGAKLCGNREKPFTTLSK